LAFSASEDKREKILFLQAPASCSALQDEDINIRRVHGKSLSSYFEALLTEASFTNLSLTMGTRVKYFDSSAQTAILKILESTKKLEDVWLVPFSSRSYPFQCRVDKHCAQNKVARVIAAMKTCQLSRGAIVPAFARMKEVKDCYVASEQPWLASHSSSLLFALMTHNHPCENYMDSLKRHFNKKSGGKKQQAQMANNTEDEMLAMIKPQDLDPRISLPAKPYINAGW
jgi:hypothetical protein